jgi:hypothetical protein
MSAMGQSQTSDDVRVTSALSLIATKSQTSHHVGDGPEADSRNAAKTTSFDYLVGELLKICRYVDAERLGGFHVDPQFDQCRQFDWQIAGIGAV